MTPDHYGRYERDDFLARCRAYDRRRRRTMSENRIEGNHQPPKTCGTCKWWARQPADPTAIGATPNGACLRMPPSVIVVGATPQGQIVTHPVYPTVPANFFACGEHRVALELAAEGG